MNITRDQVLEVLARHRGKQNGARVDRLVAEITGDATRRPGLERQIRKHVEGLRIEGSHICAHPHTGYFMANDASELRRYYTEFLRKRLITTARQIARAENIALPELLGQLRLPT